MSSSDLTADDGYQSLLGKISEVYATGQTQATQAVNAHITETYWQIGRDIVEFEQGGKTRADYGTGLLASLSRDLSLRHGKGFSRSNVKRFRQFYLVYPKGAKASHLLSWSHYVELLKLDDELERSFYEQQSLREKWSVPELMRQKKSSLFLRLAAGKDKDAILQLATQGQIIAAPSDLLRDPYVFEFLKIPEPHHPTNGLALCKNHHWAMDRNLIAPCPDHHWHVSKILDPRRSNGGKRIAQTIRAILAAPTR